MENKKILIIGVSLVTLITLVMASTAVAQPITQQEEGIVYDKRIGCLIVQVKTCPQQLYQGEKVNITLRIEAEYDIYVDYVQLNVSGVKNKRDCVLLNATRIENFNLDRNAWREHKYEVRIPEDISPGGIYGEISYRWALKGDEWLWVEITSSGFVVTYVKDKAYEELLKRYDELSRNYTELKFQFENLELQYQNLTTIFNKLSSNYTMLRESYNALQANYTWLEGNYTALKSEIGTLSNTRQLMYVFLVTTVFFVATTMYLVTRKTRRYW